MGEESTENVGTIQSSLISTDNQLKICKMTGSSQCYEHNYSYHNITYIFLHELP